jgi:hypothetical protein
MTNPSKHSNFVKDDSVMLELLDHNLDQLSMQIHQEILETCLYLTMLLPRQVDEMSSRNTLYVFPSHRQGIDAFQKQNCLMDHR